MQLVTLKRPVTVQVKFSEFFTSTHKIKVMMVREITVVYENEYRYEVVDFIPDGDNKLGWMKEETEPLQITMSPSNVESIQHDVVRHED